MKKEFRSQDSGARINEDNGNGVIKMNSEYSSQYKMPFAFLLILNSDS